MLLGPKPQPLNVARQLADLKRLFPRGEGSLIVNRLNWRCLLRPSAFSRGYFVEIAYHLGVYPTIIVIEPRPRELAGGKKPPHVYDAPGDPLCIFYPAAREWNSTMLISRTIVPWTCEWLLHFEAWMYTGQWEGGGTKHGSCGHGPLN